MDTADVGVGLSASTTPIETDSESYTLQYRTIVSGEQRSRYKEDFNSQYNEYRNLHKAIDKVSKRFSHLEEELRQQDEGTSAWQVNKETSLFFFFVFWNSILELLFIYKMILRQKIFVRFVNCAAHQKSNRPRVQGEFAGRQVPGGEATVPAPARKVGPH